MTKVPGSTVTPKVADIGYAQLDLSRGARCGAGEVVYGEGKTAEQVAGIVDALIAAGQRHVLVTRLSAEKFERARELMGSDTPLEYHADARIAIAGGMPEPSGNGTIVVACAGTSDLPVAEEAALTAGMEGALASVIGGLVSCPVIAVPTSVGYGANLGGLSALLSMLNSCASGVSVVNIDNGFGAGYQASLINHLPGRAPAQTSDARPADAQR